MTPKASHRKVETALSTLHPVRSLAFFNPVVKGGCDLQRQLQHRFLRQLRDARKSGKRASTPRLYVAGRCSGMRLQRSAARRRCTALLRAAERNRVVRDVARNGAALQSTCCSHYLQARRCAWEVHSAGALGWCYHDLFLNGAVTARKEVANVKGRCEVSLSSLCVFRDWIHEMVDCSWRACPLFGMALRTPLSGEASR